MIALHGTEDPDKSLLFTAESFFKYPFFVKNLVKKYCGDFKPQTFVEIGGSVATNVQGLFEDCTYHNIDLVDNPKIPTIIADVTKGIPLDSESVDFVYSNDAFEHLAKPWVTANEIIRILKPGGICFIGTIFSWRYHPVPEDYFCFTPAGLCSLFADMTILESNFNMHWRRDDVRGFWQSKHDSVPLDMLGGWRENWKVFMLAQKTLKKIEENPRVTNSAKKTDVTVKKSNFVGETEIASKVWEDSAPIDMPGGLKENMSSSNKEDIDNLLAEQSKKLDKMNIELNRFKGGWIQGFFEITTENCPICGNLEMVVFPYPSPIREPFRHIYCYGCKECGVSYVKKGTIDLEDYYETQYAVTNRQDRDIEPEIYFTDKYIQENANILHYFSRATRQAEVIYKNFTTPIKTVLDFGSGPGYFLKTIRAENKQAVEEDKASFKYLEYLGVQRVSLDDVQSDSIDVICASHSIEHLFIEDLPTVLGEFKRVLTNSGILYIEVPCGTLLRHSLHGRHDPHTTFFSLESLEKIMLQLDFYIIECFALSGKPAPFRKNVLYHPKKFEEYDGRNSLNIVVSKIRKKARDDKVFMLAQKTSKQIDENPRMTNPVEETKQIEENPRMPIPVEKTKEIDENLKMPNSVEETNVAIIERDFVHETEVAHKVWENSKDEEYRKDQSHWRGCGRWVNDELWQSIGQRTLKNLTNLANLRGFRSEFWLKPYNILEWGSGGGSNLFSLAKYSKTYYGVDISEKNLNEAERMIQAESYRNFKKVLIKEPSDVFIQIDKPIDIFLSTAVFQHFPTKEYGEAVLHVLSKVCRKGTLGFIQIRFDNGNETYKPINDLSEYEKRHITANSYRIDEFNDLCISNGFRVHCIQGIQSKTNYATYYLEKY